MFLQDTLIELLTEIAKQLRSGKVVLDTHKTGLSPHPSQTQMDASIMAGITAPLLTYLVSGVSLFSNCVLQVMV